MASITKCGFVPKESLFVPRDEVRHTDGDGDNTPRARIFLERVRGRNVLDDELLAPTRLHSATAGCARNVQGNVFLALGLVATAH